MLIIRLDQVNLSYGTRSIFSGASFSLNEGEKIGLIEPNGAGKSSLLRLLAGLERPAGGERSVKRGTKIAYLAQEYAGEEGATALQEVLGGRPDLLQIFEGAFVLISHDRYLLDDTIGQIAEVDGGKLTFYQGSYSSYTLQRELALLRQQELFVAQQKEIKRLEEAIARFKL